MDHRVLMVAFLRASADDPIDNRLTAAVSQHPLCHVKLVFSPGKNPMGFSIQYGERALLKATRLTNPGYQTLSLTVPVKTHDAVLRFCQDAASRGYTFDNLGMYCSLVHPGACAHVPSAAMGTTFCSKIVCEALQAGGLHEVAALCPSACLPSTLYQAFVTSPRRMLCPIRMPGTLKMMPGTLGPEAHQGRDTMI
jgi:hypothetical protein